MLRGICCALFATRYLLGGFGFNGGRAGSGAADFGKRGVEITHGTSAVAHTTQTIAHTTDEVAHGGDAVAHGGCAMAHRGDAVTHRGDAVAHGVMKGLYHSNFGCDFG